MITIRLIDARRGLHQQCESLFRDKKIADQIYFYLCDGLEECEEVEPEREKGNWIDKTYCSECGWVHESEPGFIGSVNGFNFCPNCGADMRER